MFGFNKARFSFRPPGAVCIHPAVPLVALLAGGVSAPALSQNAPEDEVRTESEVVVSASRVPVEAREVGSAVTVITDEELEQRQVRIVSDVLRDVPGLAVNRSGPVGGLTQVRIRGAEGNQTLVLIDGIEVNNPAAGSEFNFANLLNADLARIEILRGPQSSLYGSDAIGGVINVVSKRPEPGFSFLGSGEGGSFNTGNGLVSAGWGEEDFYLSGTINHLTSGNISVADERDGNDEEDPYDNTTMRFKGGATLFDMLEVDFVGIRVNSSNNLDSSVPVVNIADGDDTSETDEIYGLASAKLNLFDGMWEHIARASYSFIDGDFFDGTDTQTFSSNGEKDKFDYQTNLFFATPEVAEAEHTLSFVVEREREELRSGSSAFGFVNREIVNYGYAGEYRIGLWDRLFLSGSGRYDDNDGLFDDEFTYRGTGAVVIEETGTRLHSSFGRGVKNPTLFELFGFTPNFVGNPNLTAEDSFGWDAGVEQAFFGDRLVVDVTYFQNDIDDLITGSGNTAVNLEGSNEIHGVEITAAAEPLPGLRFDAAYTFTDAEDDNGDRLTRRPKHIASFNANYAFDAWRMPANVNLNVRFNGEQDNEVFNSFFPVETRTETLGKFTLVNVGASLQVVDGVELFARGENLFDENYQEVFGFGAPGVAAYAGVRIRFGIDPDGRI